jgi:GMP synthase-like glutamine amidotransferase
MFRSRSSEAFGFGWTSGAQTFATRGSLKAIPLPDLDTVDLLIAMGGPMSVNDEAELPWLNAEKRVVREAIARNIPVWACVSERSSSRAR